VEKESTSTRHHPDTIYDTNTKNYWEIPGHHLPGGELCSTFRWLVGCTDLPESEFSLDWFGDYYNAGMYVGDAFYRGVL